MIKYKTGLLDFSQKVGKDNDRVPANIITTEEFHEIYDKNFLVAKPNKKEKGEYAYYCETYSINGTSG